MSSSLSPIQAGSATVGAGKSVRIAFKLDAPNAKNVTIAGDFNDWDTERTRMKQNFGGLWETSVRLTHGRHRYVFVVDGECMLDPNANGTEKTEEGYKTSLIFVS